jgi:RecA-family ATPase
MTAPDHDVVGGGPNELMSAALQYAERGIPVFPCGSNKRPRTAHGFKDASTDPVQIRRWWQEFPDALIGMPTGERTGIDVLDIDDAAEFAEACDLDLSSYTTVKTRKGCHKWFRRDPAFPMKSRVRAMPGADTRGDGGYVIVPPSRHEAGEYLFEHHAPPKPMPEALRERLAERPGKAKAMAPSPPADGYCSAYGAKALQAECELVRNAPNGEQEFRLNAAALKIGALVAGGELDRSGARERLLAAAVQMEDFDPARPWTDSQLETKIERGLDHGAQTPRSAPLSGNSSGATAEEVPLKHFAPEAAHAQSKTRALVTQRAADIEPEPVEWLIEGAIPLGMMVVIGGQPGMGKSQIALKLAAAVTTGTGLPDGSSVDRLGSVIVLANEDDAARTIRPRLDAAGADIAKVHLVEGVAREGEQVDHFQLDTDVAALRAKTEEIGDVKLIIIDPPSAYLGPKVDAYKESDVRRILAPLGQLANDTGALVLLVVHLNKRTDGGAQQRFGGSTAWIAAPRAAFLVAEEEATRRRYMLPVKNNLGNDRLGFEYRVAETILNYRSGPIKAPFIEWLGTSNRSVGELLNPPKPKDTSALDEAKEFLNSQLAGGTKPAADVKAAATDAGISDATLNRAKTDLRVKSTKVENVWNWALRSIFND